MAFYTGGHAGRPAFRHSIEVDDVWAMVRPNYEGRVAFVDGEREVGGHTVGMQIISVKTSRGRAVVASDASPYYRNLEDEIPFNTLHDLPGMYSAFGRMRALASKPELILPGHDPLVMERLRKVADGIVEL